MKNLKRLVHSQRSGSWNKTSTPFPPKCRNGHCSLRRVDATVALQKKDVRGRPL